VGCHQGGSIAKQVKYNYIITDSRKRRGRDANCYRLDDTLSNWTAQAEKVPAGETY
jgi:hypothetical protein